MTALWEDLPDAQRLPALVGAPHTVAWHRTRAANRASIMQHGLQAGRSLGGRNFRVYLDTVRQDPKPRLDTAPTDLWEVDITGIPYRPDPELPGRWIIVEQDILPSRLKLVYTTEGMVRTRGQRTAALDLAGWISVAEQAMERACQAGRRWSLPDGHRDDPEVAEGRRRLSEFATRAAASMGWTEPVVCQVNEWDLDREGATGLVNGLGWISVRRNTSDLVILHEVAHVVTRTREGPGGHSPVFARAARDLYARWISPAAAETFWTLVSEHESLREAAKIAMAGRLP